MQLLPSGMPGYRMHEYRLVVPLPPALEERLTALRQQLQAKHQLRLLPEGGPTLTVLRFHAFEKMEERLLDRLQEVVRQQEPFTVELNGFAAFPSHTLYLPLAGRTPFPALCRELRTLRWLMNIPGHEPSFIEEPHLLLAHQLKPLPFIRLWLELEHQSFHSRFRTDSLLLLRCRERQDRFEPVRRLPLQALPALAKQGTLFAGL